LRRLKKIDNIKIQNILKLKTNKQEEKEEQANLYIISTLNAKFFNFDFALFNIFLRAIKELLQRFSFKLIFAKTSE
jgi:hypothetical protein